MAIGGLMWNRLLIFLMLLWSASAWAAVRGAPGDVYWVSTAGSDSNGCTASTVPLTTTAKRTIQAGKNCIDGPGQTVRVRGGTYSESWNWTGTSGTSTNRVTIEAHPGETVNWHVPSGAQQVMDIFVNFATLRGIRFDGSGGANCLHHSDGVCGNPAPGTNPYTTIPVSGANLMILISGDDVLVEGNDFTGAAYGVMLVNSGADHFTFRNNTIHQLGKIWNSNI